MEVLHSHNQKESMAVIKTSSSSHYISDSENDTNVNITLTEAKETEPQKNKDHRNPNPFLPSPSVDPTQISTEDLSSQKIPSPRESGKRSKDPGVRIVGTRIYDPYNGKSCHQCRQKTMDFAIACKGKRKNKKCTLYFCYKCLFNRYGEKAEELAKLDDWFCPKCRDVCNCSSCMKRKGFHPTGKLFRTATANGFSSVSDMLQINKSDSSKVEEGASSKKRASKSENKEPKPKRFKADTNNEHSASIIQDSGASSQKATASAKEEIEVGPERIDLNASCLDEYSELESQPDSLKIRTNKDTQAVKFEIIIESDGTSHSSEDNVEPNDSEMASDADMEVEDFDHYMETEEIQGEEKDSAVEIPLPQGTELTSIAGIEIPAEDVGHALQFLEFCKAFGKVLELNEGQPALLLRELVCDDRRSTRNDESPLIHFHIKLLSLIRDNSVKEYSLSKSKSKKFWLNALQQCLSESDVPTKESLLGFTEVGVDGYAQISPSNKLKILTFLCDEALSTPVLRSWIDEQKAEFEKKAKKAKETILPIQKEKDKDLKKRVQNEIAQALLKNNGVPLTIFEYEDLVSKIKAESSQTFADTAEDIETPMKKIAKEKVRSDAVRSEPLLLDASGRVFRKLRGYDGSSDILLQDIGNKDLDTSKDKWYRFDEQEKEMAAKYISSLRKT